MTWEEVRGKEMAPFEGVLAKGYGKAPIWVKLRIDPRRGTGSGDASLYLRVRPVYVDEVQVHDPLQQPSRLPPIGDRHPLSNLAEPSTTLLLALPRGTGPRDLWVRLQTTSTRIGYFEVLESSQLRLSQVRINHSGALYLGVIGAFILWGLVQFMIRPDRLLLAFVFYELTTLLFGAFVLGYAFLYLSDVLEPHLIDLGTSLVGLLTTCSVLVFGSCLLDELDPSIWRTRVMQAVIGTYPVLMAASVAGYEGQALKANMVLVLLMPGVLLAMAILGRQANASADMGAERLSRRVIVGYFAATLVFTLFTAAPALGIIAGGYASLYIVLFYGVSTGVLMMLLLQYRAWLNVRRQLALKAFAEEASKRARTERAQREDREKLLAMLGHELKTPLATMRMLIADRDIPEAISRRMDAGISDMTQVVERVVQAGQVEAGSILLSTQPGDLLQLIGAVRDEMPSADRVELRVEGGSPARAEVEVDATLTKMIIRNLLDNAIKYGATGEPIRLRVWLPDGNGNWQLRVSNRPGRAGMPNPAQVFQKYYRSPKASHRGGSGLGLYLVHGLAALMGGELHYEPEVDEVHFRLVMRTPLPQVMA